MNGTPVWLVLGAAPGTTVTALAFATGDEPGNVAWLSTGIDEIAEFEASQRRTGLRLGSAGVGLLGLVVANVILGIRGRADRALAAADAWEFGAGHQLHSRPTGNAATARRADVTHPRTLQAGPRPSPVPPPPAWDSPP